MNQIYSESSYGRSRRFTNHILLLSILVFLIYFAFKNFTNSIPQNINKFLLCCLILIPISLVIEHSVAIFECCTFYFAPKKHKSWKIPYRILFFHGLLFLPGWIFIISAIPCAHIPNTPPSLMLLPIIAYGAACCYVTLYVVYMYQMTHYIRNRHQ